MERDDEGGMRKDSDGGDTENLFGIYLIILVGMFSLRYQFSAGMEGGQVVATRVMIRLITSLHGTSDIRQVLPVFTPAWVDIVTENYWRGSHLHE